VVVDYAIKEFEGTFVESTNKSDAIAIEANQKAKEAKDESSMANTLANEANRIASKSNDIASDAKQDALKANDIAEASNKIATEGNKKAQYANYLSACSLIVSIIAILASSGCSLIPFVVSLFHKLIQSIF